MSFETSVRKVFQTMLDEHRGNAERALWDLSHRFVVAERGTSWALLRRMNPATEGRIDDVPNPISDEWISTARERA